EALALGATGARLLALVTLGGGAAVAGAGPAPDALALANRTASRTQLVQLHGRSPSRPPAAGRNLLTSRPVAPGPDALSAAACRAAAGCPRGRRCDSCGAARAHRASPSPSASR